MSPRAANPAGTRIVLVGTPSYDDLALSDVPAVANNIADLAEVLTHPDLGGFERSSCTVAPARAGIEQIGDLLTDAAAEAEDLLLFYFSGHGLLGPLRQELYLSLAGTRHDRLAFSALPFDAVRDACLSSRAKSRVVILDSCFSGRAIGQTLAGEEESVLGQIHVAGTYTLTSAPANRAALFLPGERNTAFTGRMLDFLRTGSHSAGPVLTLGDIYKHLYTRLRSEGLPTPQQRGTETADLLGLVRNRYGTVAPPKPSPPPAAEDQKLHGPEVESRIAISFTEALRGVTMPLRRTSEDLCSPCAGTGARAGTTSRVCPTCSDTGQLHSDSTPCQTCGGRGLVVDQPCPSCQGSGRRTSTYDMRVRVPAGVRDGQRMRLAGKGAPGRGSEQPGDLYLMVQVQPHRYFGREGDDLTVTVPVTFPEAVFGADIRVPVLESLPVKVTLPAGSASGRTQRLSGGGVPRKDGTIGDLLIRFDIVVPVEIPEVAKDALRRYQSLSGDHWQLLRLKQPDLVKDGDNVAVTVPVTFPDAVFGAEIRVPTVEGRRVTVKLPAGIANGRTVRLRGRGLAREDGTTGDQLVTIEVAVPTALRDEAKAALRRFQDLTSDFSPRPKEMYESY